MGTVKKDIDITIEITIPVTIEIVDDPGDTYTAPYSHIRLEEYNEKLVTSIVEVAMHKYISENTEEILDEA